MDKRLSKALAAAGVASRRACEKIIFSGRVKVNGSTVLIPQTPVCWERDKIELDGELLTGEDSKKYFILNKPVGYICSNKRRPGGRIIGDLYVDPDVRLFTVGRLDKDTSGLIIVTNDGHFANRVIHPRYNVEKEYIAKTDKEITAAHLSAISQGALVEDAFVKPVSVKKVRRGTVKVVVTDGKKHEVRILLENAGLKVLQLARVRIGQLRLGDLPLGRWKEMSENERQMVLGG